jgi:hypothetical protein
MANQSKLKAWVRYDGTNTVVTAGPIFRASKPKVGNWRQINADLCCNGSTPSTTTTTSTLPLTTTTTTTSVPVYSQDVNAAYTSAICDGSGNQLTLYYNNLTIGLGSFFYTDPELTTPYAGQNGPYVRMYFSAQYNVVYISPSGELIQIMTGC